MRSRRSPGTLVKNCLKALIALLTLCATLSAQAGPLYSTSGGRLLGIQGVDYLGKVYDVMFRSGSCEVVYHGCDAASDLPFPVVEASGAMKLLMALIQDGGAGNFDSEPG